MNALIRHVDPDAKTLESHIGLGSFGPEKREVSAVGKNNLYLFNL